jgi:DNA repair exonuclease SbcCD ATPase subunit
MRITRLQLRDLGRHRNLDIALAPGFTIIRGPNEAGKSTVQRGLELALFRKPTATAAELETLRSWGAGPDDRSYVRLEFVVDEETDTGEVTSRNGVLEKEFRGTHGRVSVEYDGQTYTDPARADEFIAGLTGIPNEAFFRSTASIRHQELDDLDRDEGALRDRLQASIGGGDRGSSRAKSRLEDAVRGLRSRGEKNPGRLKIAEEAVNRAEQALKTGEGMLEKLETDRDALAQSRDARLRAETALTESRNLLELARQAERLRTDRAVIAERYERLRQAAEAQKRLQELEGMPERPMSALRDQLDRMRTLQSRVAVLQEALREDSAPEVEPDEPEPAYLGWGLVTLAIVGLAVASLVLGVLKSLPIVAIIGVVELAIAFYLGFRFLERRSVARNVQHLNKARERDRVLRRQSRVGTEEGLRVAHSGVQNILRELGVADVAAAERLLTGEQARRQEIATLQVQVNALLAGQAQGSVTELRDRAAMEIEQKTSALQSLGPLATDARSRERLEAEVRERHAALERSRDAEAAAIARVDANPVDAEQVAGEAERLVTWRDQLAALQRRVRVYEKTLSAISEAESLTMRKATRYLEQQVGRDMARLTGGRYRRVSIDDQTLDISVWAVERGDWVPAGRLSKGTVDQVFLAARMGLVRLVTQGRRPPLILDDPFVTFDDTRASRAALLLRELSSDFQVIYLACSNRYDGLADTVIQLSGPTEADAAGAPRPSPTAAPAAASPAAQAAPGLAAVPAPAAPAPPVAPVPAPPASPVEPAESHEPAELVPTPGEPSAEPGEAPAQPFEPAPSAVEPAVAPEPAVTEVGETVEPAAETVEPAAETVEPAAELVEQPAPDDAEEGESLVRIEDPTAPEAHDEAGEEQAASPPDPESLATRPWVSSEDD